MTDMPDTHLMQAAEQRARQWLEGGGIETAKLDFLAEDILRLVGELRDLRRASMTSLHARVTELERETARCTSCDHLMAEHQPEGCRRAVIVGTVGMDLVCPCVVQG